MNCYQAKAGELAQHWFVIDASGQVVGRLAAQIAPILMGKHRPTYTPHIDTGDYVIVTNVDKVIFTGNKWQEKSYQRYSGYPGGQRDEAAWKLFQRHPERILELAIQRMMPKSKLGRHMMDKLKLYVGPDHPHQSQQPVPLPALSGKPASAGALFAPPPVPYGSRKKAAKAKAAAGVGASPATRHAHDHAAHDHAHEHAAHDHDHDHDHGHQPTPPHDLAVEPAPATEPEPESEE